MEPHALINVARLPGIRGALWDLAVQELPAEDLLHLYEDRWRYVDEEKMSHHERQLLDDLIESIGRGVFLGR